MNKLHWANKFIGKPWKLGAGGENNCFDCFGLVAKVLRDRYGRDITRESLDLKNHKNFETCKCKDGAICLIKHGDIIHVGVWVKDYICNGLLHSVEGIGVIYNESNMIESSYQIKGFYDYKNERYGFCNC